ncbi:MAG TPA: hypothetical protein VFY17_05800, partial [Pilimelia sp.]|nr:hypothetical protein [Pilimelia sp.]
PPHRQSALPPVSPGRTSPAAPPPVSPGRTGPAAPPDARRWGADPREAVRPDADQPRAGRPPGPEQRPRTGRSGPAERPRLDRAGGPDSARDAAPGPTAQAPGAVPAHRTRPFPGLRGEPSRPDPTVARTPPVPVLPPASPPGSGRAAGRPPLDRQQPSSHQGLQRHHPAGYQQPPARTPLPGQPLPSVPGLGQAPAGAPPPGPALPSPAAGPVPPAPPARPAATPAAGAPGARSAGVAEASTAEVPRVPGTPAGPGPAIRGASAQIRRQLRERKRLRLATLVVGCVVILGAVPLFLGVRASVSDPVLAALDTLEVPAWAAAQARDESSGSAWCVKECRFRERRATSERAAAETNALYETRLADSGWRRWRVDRCPGQPLREGEFYSCWRRDEYTLDLWVRTPTCEDAATECGGAAVSMKVRLAVADERTDPRGRGTDPRETGEDPDPVFTDPVAPTQRPS